MCYGQEAPEGRRRAEAVGVAVLQPRQGTVTQRDGRLPSGHVSLLRPEGRVQFGHIRLGLPGPTTALVPAERPAALICVDRSQGPGLGMGSGV